MDVRRVLSAVLLHSKYRDCATKTLGRLCVIQGTFGEHSGSRCRYQMLEKSRKKLLFYKKWKEFTLLKIHMA